MGYNTAMNEKKSVLIIGNYGATNLGDEAILESILQTVRASAPTADIKVLSSNPQNTTKLHGVATIRMVPSGFRSFFGSIFNGSLGRIFKTFRHSDAIIFGGGGLFTDEKFQAIFIWLMQIFPALLYRKKIMCFGQSVGPLKSVWSRAIVRFIFKKIEIITVRDDASHALLCSLGIKNVQVLPDPVFGLKTKNILHVSELAAETGTDHGSQKVSHSAPRSARIDEPFVFFSIRPWFHQSPQFFQTLADFVDWLYEKHHLKTVFVPFQREHDDDNAVMLKIVSLLKHKMAAEISSYDERTDAALLLMSQAKAVVGMRLHSLIFSTLTATPFLALSYSKKVSEVVHQLGMENYLTHTSDLELKKLQHQFDALLTGQEEIIKTLKEKQQEFVQKNENYGVFFQKLIDDRSPKRSSTLRDSEIQ